MNKVRKSMKVIHQDKGDQIPKRQKDHVCEEFKSVWLKINKQTKTEASKNQPYLRESP